MAEPMANRAEEGQEDEGGGEENAEGTIKTVCLLEEMSRKEKRKAKKKMKRKQMRKDMAEKEREEDEARLNNPEEQRRLRMMEEEEKERVERERKEFEERERAWIEAMERKRKEEEEKEEEERRKALVEEESNRLQVENVDELNEGDHWEYVEEGPAEIIWQGNEIIVKKKRIRVPKNDAKQQSSGENAERPTSNPLPPQSEAYADYKHASVLSAEQNVENVGQQVPNFGTEQDKAHCPFHLKTGACRFGLRCSRVHFYPDKSCTLLIRNMYNGPGLAWEQDEGLEYTDEEVEHCYEEFYEDVHTEFLKFGEIVNFKENNSFLSVEQFVMDNKYDFFCAKCWKVCRNGSFHLRGNVYVQYKSLDSAVLAFNSINGRYFAGKQVRCEFVNVARWKVAICGEYMKSRFKTCSHGTACNFIHCFRNPGGDYEWADCDKPPPKYWLRKMAALFGCSDEDGYEKQVEQENLKKLRNSSKMLTDMDRYRSRPKSKEMDCLKTRTHDTDPDGELLDKDGGRGRCRDGHVGSWRKYSREQNRDFKHRTREGESEGDWSDGNGDRETYRGHSRKSSRHSRKAKYLNDDRRDQERVVEDWSDRDGDRETCDAGMTRSSSRQRKVDRGNSENGTHDSDGEWSHRDRDTDRRHRRRKRLRNQSKEEHHDDHGESKNKNFDPGEWSDRDNNRVRHRSRRRRSSGQDRKVSEVSGGRGNSPSRADDSGCIYDSSGSDGGKHHSQASKHARPGNEVSDFSYDEGKPTKELQGKVAKREPSVEKSGLERGFMHWSPEPSSSGQCVGRYEPCDLDFVDNSGKYVDKRDRWEPDQVSL